MSSFLKSLHQAEFTKWLMPPWSHFKNTFEAHTFLICRSQKVPWAVKLLLRSCAVKQPRNQHPLGLKKVRALPVDFSSHTVGLFNSHLQLLNIAFEIPCIAIITVLFFLICAKIGVCMYPESIVMVNKLLWQPSVAAAHQAVKFVFCLVC